MNNKIFSFWNYLYISDSIDIKTIVKKWKDCGINVAMSFAYNPLNCSKKKMIELLDECDKQGLKVIINDDRTSFLQLDKIDKETFYSNIKQAYLDFGKHKATYGFFIGDEPDFDHVDNFIYTAKIVKEIMPDLIHFGNLLPYWGDKKTCEKNGFSEQFFYQLVSRILKETSLKIIGFDHYTQCFDTYQDQEKGIEFFLYDLRMYQRVCKEFNIPFIVSILSTQHWQHRIVNHDDIRWQISTSFAHGAEGIMWFYFHQKSLDTGFGLSPFIGEDLVETDLYRTLLVEQKRIINNYFPLFDNLSFKEVKYIDKENDFKYEDDILEEFKTDRNTLTFISEFIDKTNKDEYLMITNGDQNISNHYSFLISGSREDFWLLPGEFKLIKKFKRKEEN